MGRRRWIAIAVALVPLIGLGVWAAFLREEGDPRAWRMHWARIDDPARDRLPQTRMIEEAADVREGMRVADVGAGAGYWAFRFARAVGPRGRVIATDVDPSMVSFMEHERERRGVAQLEPRHVSGDAPGLEPRSLDRIVLVDSLSFSECEGLDRRAYLGALRAALRPGGHMLVYRDEVHTPAWTPPLGEPLRCSEPRGEELVELAAPLFRARRMVERPAGDRRGTHPGFLVVLEPR